MAEPVTLEQAKSHLRVQGSSEDTLINDKIGAAREWVENYTGLVLTRRAVTERVASFAHHLRLRAWPVAADQPIAISYRDSFGVDQQITNVIARAATRPAIIHPAHGFRWPHGSAIDATFTAGFATPDAVPKVLKEAMLVMLTAYYEDREGGDLFTKAEASARSLCRAHRGRTL